jgi:small-conductance mechanosensitive channel
MNDLIAIAETVTRDHLVRAFALIAVGTLVTRLLFKRYPIGRTVARIVFLFLLTVFLLRQGIVPYQPLRVTDAPFRDAIEGTLKIAWWLWGTWFLIGLLRSTVVFERRPREGKLVQDVLSGLIYLAVAFAIIAYVFGLPVQGLLATSGAIAIILGLALQSTLNDVFSGLVLNCSRPYRPGDWITIEGGTEGRVVEMNWRDAPSNSCPKARCHGDLAQAVYGGPIDRLRHPHVGSCAGPKQPQRVYDCIRTQYGK